MTARDSIAHWERNVAAETPEEASVRGADCALCRVFANKNCVSCCEGCPIAQNTGGNFCFCFNTPYYPARDALDAWRDNPTDATRDAWRAAAQAMLDFLKELLPVEKLS